MLIPATADFAALLLDWYDRHARVLPWRSAPGTAVPDPYPVWLSEVMLQQTQVATVMPYFAAFMARWPTVEALAAAPEADVMRAWAGLGYYSRARNLVRCARQVVRDGGFADTEAALRQLPGVGAYTAAAIAAIAFDRRAVVVDGNVERVVARLFAVDTPLPAAKAALRGQAAEITPEKRCGDFAQAMMDLGATICTPRLPSCNLCPLSEHCLAFATGDPAGYPRRMAKAAKPDRTATAWWFEREGSVLLVRRADRGLLGGMLALPSTLGEANAERGGRLLGSVTHVFTHFRLTLAVVAPEPGCNPPPGGEWWPLDRVEEAGLPTLFAKAAGIVMKAR